jgi:hypothetical protein
MRYLKASMQKHEDDPDDSNWFHGAPVRADKQRINSCNSEDEYDRETGDGDEQLDAKPGGDEVILAGMPHCPHVARVCD